MRTLFACISDVHLRMENKSTVKEKLKDALIKLKSHMLLKQASNVVVLFPGDIVFSGKNDEYAEISSIIAEFSESFIIVFSPGNHDHDFSAYSGKIREQLLKTELSEIDNDILLEASKGLGNYLNFEQKYVNAIPSGNETVLSKEYIVNDGDQTISITRLNTAWCSQLNERGGDLRFPLSQLKAPSNDSALSIVILHHPLSWFEPINQKEIRNFFRDNYDIVITGHEHLHDSFQILSPNNSVFVLESMPLDDKGVTHNGFFTFYIDEDRVFLDTFIYHGAILRCSETTDSVSFRGYSDESLTVLSPDFHRFLNEHGTGFIHPDKDKLTLDDIFIYPNVRDLSNEGRKIERLSSSRIIEDGQLDRIMLIGEESIGKTTLLKKLYIDLVAKQHKPIYINARTLNKPNKFDEKRISKIIS